MPSKGQKQVALIVETSNEYARGLLRGIRRYIREHSAWSIFVEEYGRENIDLSWLLNWNGDGILARIENERIAYFVKKTGLPVVDLSASRLLPDVPFAETDDQAIAKLAVEHFQERGFKYFAFCGNSRYNWSKNRHFYFRTFSERLGVACYEYDIHSPGHLSRIDARHEMAKWLSTLPKPIGIMAAFDILGLQIVEACRSSGIDVPEKVAVLGVDNDTLLSELSDPPLSSIIPNTLKTGYCASYLLDRLMAGDTDYALTNLIEPVGIATRKSTDVMAIEDPIVANAIQYIRNHACDGILIRDLLDQIPISRRVLEHRFQLCLGKSPHELINSFRTRTIQQLLLETNLPIAAIAERTGFTNTEYMSVFFKKATGLTPSRYRSNFYRNL